MHVPRSGTSTVSSTTGRRLRSGHVCGLIPRQDFSNIERQQRGVHTRSFEGMRLATECERLISNVHEELDPDLTL